MSQVTFQYRAVDRAGAKIKGSLEAADRNDAYRQLKSSGLRPLKLVAHVRSKRGGRKKVSLKDISHFTYQISVLLEAGINIIDAIRSIAAQETNERFKAVLDDVARRIASGMNITEAMLPYRNVFGDVYVETVRAAELSGNMVEVMGKLAEMLDAQYDSTKSIKGAMVYPACVVSAMFLACAFLMIAVVPRFSTMFASRGVELPLPTQFLIFVSLMFTDYWYLMIATGVGTYFGVRKAWASPKMRPVIDGWMHKVPVMRELLRGYAVSRFCHVFAITLRSGISLIDALEISGRASGRPLMKDDAEKMQEQVKHGGRLSDVMMRCGYLPGFAKRLFTAGEEAAELTRMSEIVARHYDREVAHMTKNLATVIEPILVVGLAGMVLLIALGIFMPMWDMSGMFG